MVCIYCTTVNMFWQQYMLKLKMLLRNAGFQNIHNVVGNASNVNSTFIFASLMDSQWHKHNSRCSTSFENIFREQKLESYRLQS